jgi:hypothetical protein
MFTRSAIFCGQIKPGMEDAFYAAVQERLLPAWQNMLHAQAVRLFRPQEAEGPLQDVFLVQEIDYPSRDHIAQALASDRRLAAMAALDSVRHMYEGAHHHIIYQRL